MENLDKKINGTPLVSIIMPCYNAEAFLIHAIDSMLSQTFTDFEFIIIDDCSSDRSAAIIHEYLKRDHRIRYLKNEKNQGVAASLNVGIETSRGEFIARMDADDISAPDRLMKQVDYMKGHPSCVGCGTNIIFIDINENIIGTREYNQTEETIKKRIHRASCFAHPTVMLRKKTLIDNNLLYSSRLRWVEDYDLWFRLADFGTYENLNEYLLYYRLSSSSVKNTHCKESLINTIKLKFMYLSRATVISCIVLCAEISLLFLPTGIILYLYEYRYRKRKNILNRKIISPESV